MSKASRKKKWQKVNGLVLLNKPEGITSNGLLQQVRRLYQAEKAGHTGALDPFATGLLPICLGEATKVSGLLLDSDKTYQATLKLGEATDTADKEGEVAEIQTVPELTEASISKALASFLGDITQVPPMYSALKFEGKPLYYYARQGIEIERPARHVHIFLLQLDAFNGEDEIKFTVKCSKGTYVRTLGEDIAKALGTVGHLTALHRIQTGSLTAEQMVDYETLQQEKEARLLAFDLPLTHLPMLNLTEEQADWIMHGGMLDLPKPDAELIRFYNPQQQFIGVGEWSEKKQAIKPKRLFNL